MSSRAYFFVFLLGLTCCSSIASAEPPEVPFHGAAPQVLPPRLALVIGVRYYQPTGNNLVLNELPDAAEDAEAVAQKLGDAGFTPQTLISSPAAKYIEKTAIQQAVTKFVQTAIKKKEETGRRPILLFYFAGHGFSFNDENYLLPSNFYGAELDEAIGNSIELRRQIVDKLDAADPAIQIIITDSCRTGLSQSLSNTALVWGAKNPSKLIPPLAPNTFGRKKVVFLYSTLDGQPAYGEPGHGGRFTQTLVRVLEHFKDDAINSAQSETVPPKPASLQDLYDKIQYNMQLMATGKWQAPQIDPNRGSRFYPFPTGFDYQQERLSWEALDQDIDIPTPSASHPAPSFKKIILRRICRLTDLLFKFSEFSYFSPEIIKALQAAQSDFGEDISLDDDRCKNLPPLVVPPAREKGKWDLSSPAEPTNNAPKAQERSGKASNLIRLASSSETIILADDVTREKTNTLQAPEPAPTVQTNPNEDAVKLTFGDVKRAIESSSSQVKILTGVLPAPDVPLDRAVVTKTEAFLRAGAGPQYPSLRALPAGELLEVVGTSPGRTWLEVRHKNLGGGFISGDLVEPALVRLSKVVEFSHRALEPDEKGKSDLLYTFALLGGAVIVDATVEYPSRDGTVGFTRASTTAAFIGSVSHSPNTGGKGRLFIPVQENASSANPVEQQTVRLTILCLPLDQMTRALLAQLSSPSRPVSVEVRPPAETNQPTSPTSTSQSGLVYCTSKTDCRPDSPAGGTNSEYRATVQSLSPNIGIDTLQRLSPLFGH